MLNINKFVKTQHGLGIIVGKDLPKSRAWRWVVQITEPIEQYKEFVLNFKEQKLCYHIKDILYIEDEMK